MYFKKILYKETFDFSVVSAYKKQKKKEVLNGIKYRSQNGYHGRV